MYYYRHIDYLDPSDLPEVQTAIWDVRYKWYKLGMELGIKQETLKSIKANYHNDEACFKEMLSAWLHSDPHPSWERLLAALEQPYVGYSELTVDLTAKMDMSNQPGGECLQNRLTVNS